MPNIGGENENIWAMATVMMLSSVVTRVQGKPVKRRRAWVRSDLTDFISNLPGSPLRLDPGHGLRAGTGRVFTAEAGGAELRAPLSYCLNHIIKGLIDELIGPDKLSDLGDGVGPGHKFASGCHIDPVDAGVS